MPTLLRRFLVLIALFSALSFAAAAENPEMDRAFGDGVTALYYQKYDESIAALTKAITLDPTYVLAYCNRATAYQMSGRLDQALADINRAVELAPRYSGVYLTRGGIYLDRREPEKALSDFNRAIELKPIPVMFSYRGEAYFTLGRYDLAIKDLDQAISPANLPEPENQDRLDLGTAVIELAKDRQYYYRGLAHQHLGQWVEAQADLTKAAELDPQVAAMLPKTAAATGSPPPLAQAIKVYAGALEEEPSDEGAYFDPGCAGFADHDYASALKNLDTILQLNPADNQARIDRSYAQFKLNNYERSENDTSIALNFNSNNRDALNNRALAYLTTGEYDRAIEDYKKVIQLILGSGISTDPAIADRQALTYCGLGKAFGLKGDAVNALACFNLAIRTAPGLALIYRFRGDYETANGDDTRALADYSHAIQLNPDSAEALAGRAWVLATSLTTGINDPTAAVADATKSCDLTAWNDPDLLEVLAAACAGAGDFANAIKWQCQAVDILDHEPDQSTEAEAKRRLDLYRDQKPFISP